jgi:hypothetical protein
MDSLKYLQKLEVLDLDFNGTMIKHAPAFVDANNRLPALHTLILSFWRCGSLINASEIMQCIVFLQELHTCKISCKLVPLSQLTELTTQKHAPAKLKNLEVVVVESALKDVGAFNASLSRLQFLQSLVLNFDLCRASKVLNELEGVMPHLTQIQNIDLDCSRSLVTRLPPLASQASTLPSLRSLRMRCYNSSCLADVAPFLGSLRHMPDLHKLRIDLGGPAEFKSFGGLASEDFPLLSLVSLKVVLRWNDQLSDLDDFVDSLEYLPALQDFILDVRDCGAFPRHCQTVYDQVSGVHAIPRCVGE